MIARKQLWSFLWLLTPFFLLTLSSFFFTHIIYDDFLFYVGLFFLSGLGCIFGLSVFLSGRSQNRLLFVIRVLLVVSIFAVFLTSVVQLYRTSVDTYSYVTKHATFSYGLLENATSLDDNLQSFTLQSVEDLKKTEEFTVPSSLRYATNAYHHQYVKVGYLPYNHQLVSLSIVKEN